MRRVLTEPEARLRVLLILKLNKNTETIWLPENLLWIDADVDYRMKVKEMNEKALCSYSFFLVIIFIFFTVYVYIPGSMSGVQKVKFFL